MIKSLKLKEIFLLSGILITVSGFFLPLYSTCSEDPDGYISESISGGKHFVYYMSLFFIILVIVSGYIGKGSLAALIIFTVLGGGITIFYNMIGQAGWGKPCGHTPTQFQNLLYSGHIMIILSCFLNIYHVKKRQRMENDLLDQ